jgi:L-fuculose-phosphate aldolase
MADFRAMRKQLVGLVRSLLEKDLIFGTEGNISMRVPGASQMLITPGKTRKATLTEDDLMVVTFDGELIEGPDKPSSGTPLHGQTYKRRPDVNAAIHTHSPYTTAVAVARGSIPPIHDYVVTVIGGTVTTAPWDPFRDATEAVDTILEHLGDKRAVLIANHGLYVVGSSLEQAMEVCQQVESIAMYQATAAALGGAVELHPDVVKACREAYLASVRAASARGSR